MKREGDPNRFSDFIKKLRKERGLSTIQVKKRSNNMVSDCYVSQIENRKRRIPSLEIIKAFSVAFEVPMEVLLRETGYAKYDSNINVETEVLISLYDDLSEAGKIMAKNAIKSIKVYECEFLKRNV